MLYVVCSEEYFKHQLAAEVQMKMMHKMISSLKPYIKVLTSPDAA